MEELNAAMDVGTSRAVKIWMNWMGIIFLSSLIFVWKRKPARWVLAAIILTLPIGFVVWKMTGSVHMLGIAHLIVWLPLAIYLYKAEFSKTAEASTLSLSQRLKSPYFIWLCLLLTTIVISLIFDVRDIFLVLTGAK